MYSQGFGVKKHTIVVGITAKKRSYL